MKFSIARISAMTVALSAMLLCAVPVKAEEYPIGGPWGDINGYYTWYRNGKGQTIFCQDGAQWRYDAYGNRMYVDANGNLINNGGSSSAKASTIAAMGLTYYNTVNGVEIYSNGNGQLYTVDNNGHMSYYGTTNGGTAPNLPEPAVKTYTMTYTLTTVNGTHIYKDEHGNYWWFAEGGIPNPYYGDWQGTWWKDGVPNYTYNYAGISADGYYLWKDDYGHYWWFEAGGQPHRYNGTPANPYTPGRNPSVDPNPKPAETNVDWNVHNVMEADGIKSIVYKGQYWQAPKSISWAPQGMHLIGWDYAENTGYVRWKPGAWILNTGSDVYLYPVYANN